MIHEEITRVYPELLKMVGKLTQNHEATTDLIHDVVLMFLELPEEKQQKIYNDDKIKEYLYITAKTQFFSSNSTCHKNYRENQSLNINDSVEVEDVELEDYDYHNTNELRIIFTAMVSILTPTERQMIYDRIFEDKTYVEIAKKHGLTLPIATKKVKETINKLKTESYGNL